MAEVPYRGVANLSCGYSEIMSNNVEQYYTFFHNLKKKLIL